MRKRKERKKKHKEMIMRWKERKKKHKEMDDKI